VRAGPNISDSRVKSNPVVLNSKHLAALKSKRSDDQPLRSRTVVYLDGRGKARNVTENACNGSSRQLVSLASSPKSLGPCTRLTVVTELALTLEC